MTAHLWSLGHAFTTKLIYTTKPVYHEATLLSTIIQSAKKSYVKMTLEEGYYEIVAQNVE